MLKVSAAQHTLETMLQGNYSQFRGN